MISKERLRTSIEGRWPSIKEFSEQSGVKYRTLQQYLNGDRQPGAEALGRFLSAGISVDWLLGGLGSMYVGRSGGGNAEKHTRPQPRSRLYDELKTGKDDFYARLNMESLVSLAGGSQMGTVWAMLGQVINAYPRPLTLETAMDAFHLQGSVTRENVAGSLVALMAMGCVEERPESGKVGYTLLNDIATIRTNGLHDKSNHITEGVLSLTRKIGPKLLREPQNAKLVTANFRCNGDSSQRLLNSLCEALRTECNRIAPGDRSLTMVFGAAV